MRNLRATRLLRERRRLVRDQGKDDSMGKESGGTRRTGAVVHGRRLQRQPGARVAGPSFSSTQPPDKSRDASGAEPETTNNRMELMGVIEGLASLKRPCQVELVTDSQYVAKGISEWLPNWKRQGWQRKEKGQLKPVANVDLWQKIDSLLSVHKVRVTHVLGHRGHPENEACDRMAVEAYKQLVEEQKVQRESRL